MPIKTGVKWFDDFSKGLDDLTNTVGKVIGATPLKTAIKIGKAIVDAGGTTSQKSIDEAILSAKALKELEEMKKRINKKNPVAPKKEPKFDKSRKPIKDTRKPKDIFNPLPLPVFVPKSEDSPKGEKERVILFNQNKSLTSMDWGGLISYPVVYGKNNEPERLVLLQQKGVVLEARRESNLKDNAKKFLSWLLINSVDTPQNVLDKIDSTQLPTIAGQSVLLFPENLHNLSGDMSFLFGTESIRDIYTNFSSSSNNVYCDGYTLRGVAYGNIDVNSTDFDLKNSEWDYSEKALQNNFPFEISNSAGNLNKAVGIDIDNPIKVPTSLIGYTDKELQALRYQQILGLEEEFKNGGLDDNEKKEVTEEIKRLKNEPIKRYQEIKSIADFVGWSTVAIHELIGDFPVKFEWHKSDIIQIGNKPKEKPEENNLPLIEWVDDNTQITRNYSLTGMLRDLIISSKINDGMTGLNLRQGTSALMEIGMTRQLLIKTEALIDTIHDFIGIATNKVKKKVPFMFDATQLIDYDKFLTPDEIEVLVDEIDVKVEKSTLSEAINTIYESAQIIKAVHTVRVGDRGKWKTRIKGLRGIIQKAIPESGSFSTFTEGEDGNVTENQSSRPKTDFDDWCEAVESGFTTDGILKPWNGKFGDRPRITDVSGNMLDKS